MMIRCLIICFCLMGHSLANCVSWGSLTPLQQEVLVDYRSVWHLLLSEDQSVLEAGAFRSGKADEDSLQGFQEVYENWVRLSPGERAELRSRWEAFLALPADERRGIKMGLRHLRKLPREKREFMRSLILREEVP